jgi:arylsulfatase A-like enzyme
VYGRTPQLDPEKPHVAELLGEQGYRTMGFSNSYHTSPDRGFARGFDYYHDLLSLPRFAGKMYEPSFDYVKHLYDYFVRDYDDSAFQLRRLRTQLRRGSEPFFTFINLNSAHSPYDPPRRYKREFERYAPDQSVDRESAHVVSEDAYKWILGDVTAGDAEWELLKAWYDGELRYLDDQLGALFQYLRDRDLYEETAIIVTSDHGEQFGENGLVYHQFSLSETLIHVPLLIKWPGQTESRKSDELVSLVDLAPTAVNLAGGSIPNEMDGRSLRTDPEPDAVFAEYAGPNESMCERFRGRERDYTNYLRGYQAVRTRDRKLVRATDGTVSLYDVTGEETAVTDSEQQSALLNRLDEALTPLPNDEDDEQLADHVESHLKEMGYM